MICKADFDRIEHVFDVAAYDSAKASNAGGETLAHDEMLALLDAPSPLAFWRGKQHERVAVRRGGWRVARGLRVRRARAARAKATVSAEPIGRVGALLPRELSLGSNWGNVPSNRTGWATRWFVF
jgi:hypothetical protein